MDISQRCLTNISNGESDNILKKIKIFEKLKYFCENFLSFLWRKIVGPGFALGKWGLDLHLTYFKYYFIL